MPASLVRSVDPDVHGAPDLEHVAAVERAGRLDRQERDAGPFERGPCRVDLAAPRIRTRAGEHRDVAEHDDGVFDEHPVGVVIGRIDRDDLPAALPEDVDVGLPLTKREVGVGGDALDVGDLAIGEAGRRAADEKARHAVQANARQWCANGCELSTPDVAMARVQTAQAKVISMRCGL